MKRFLSCIVIALSFYGYFFAQGTSESPSLSIGILNGPSAVPAATIIENHPEYDFQIFSGADLEVPKLLKGELDVGILPPNAAAKLWSKSGGDIVALAVIGEGNLSLLTTDSTYKDLKSLKGKTVYCAGRGATPEYIFRHILEQKGLENDVNLDFSIPNPELAASLISGKAKYILVPEPFATVALTKGKDKGVRKVYNPSDEIEFAAHNFPMTLLVCNKKALLEKSEQIASLLDVYEEATKWTINHPKEAGALVEKHTLGLTAQITALSIPNASYVFSPALDSCIRVNKLLEIFYKKDPDSIGGKLPDITFYR